VARASEIIENSGMRLAKLALGCVLSLGVLFQGFASAGGMEASCPMGQAGVESAAESALQGEARQLGGRGR
jgi:hypothetical protein